jgi:hypothetical protein
MRISSLLAHLTKKLIVYNLFVSSRNIISIDGRIAEQTSRSNAMATMRKDLFYTFSVVRDISFRIEQVASCGLLFDQKFCSV